jgi:DNA adenine methylase
MVEINLVKPIIKWAGGKRQIMKDIMNNFPSEFNNYHEPFIGGGSVMIELYNRGLLKNKKVYVSDNMKPLIDMYDIVYNFKDNLIKELSNEEQYKNTKEMYTVNKQKFNKLKDKTDNEQKILIATLFIYLNRVGFNGMYRENKKGEFNIPYGKQKNPTICNKEMIEKVNLMFNELNIEIKCQDFEDGYNHINNGDFIYFDPPYYSTFSQYTKNSFDENEHIRLKNYVKKLAEKGCKVAVSNSDTEYIRELYKDIPNIKFIDINVKRMINCKSSERGKVKKEILIINY